MANPKRYNGLTREQQRRRNATLLKNDPNTYSRSGANTRTPDVATAYLNDPRVISRMGESRIQAARILNSGRFFAVGTEGQGWGRARVIEPSADWITRERQVRAAFGLSVG